MVGGPCRLPAQLYGARRRRCPSTCGAGSSGLRFPACSSGWVRQGRETAPPCLSSQTAGRDPPHRGLGEPCDRSPVAGGPEPQQNRRCPPGGRAPSSRRMSPTSGKGLRLKSESTAAIQRVTPACLGLPSGRTGGPTVLDRDRNEHGKASLAVQPGGVSRQVEGPPSLLRLNTRWTCVSPLLPQPHTQVKVQTRPQICKRHELESCPQRPWVLPMQPRRP